MADDVGLHAAFTSRRRMADDVLTRSTRVCCVCVAGGARARVRRRAGEVLRPCRLAAGGGASGTAGEDPPCPALRGEGRWCCPLVAVHTSNGTDGRAEWAGR